ncbi:elongator complex protein 2-like isoform X2 [Pomacea canaliculata]|uniref:elongator complex protein 2-like isoform X2 n=1 Tax=Pomacea canaliculata TaxID=400727 RepID=UPI000D73C992|nr:elongator complex protein 2-like isoform X2 [Pomacea canaliculata]
MVCDAKNQNIMVVTVCTCYVSSGCNRVPHCADWGKNNLICYGSCNNVAIYQPEVETLQNADTVRGGGGTLYMLTSHTDRVNSTRWIPSPHCTLYPEIELVSCSVDMTAIVWHYKDQTHWEKHAVLSGHQGSVTVSAAVYIGSRSKEFSKESELLVATASSDSTVRLWQRKPFCEDIFAVQTLFFGTGFVLDLSLLMIPATQVPILACGADDHKVHLYVRQGEQFMPVIKLAGHEDWVRGLDMTVDDIGDILLASCAQDHLIRIWRFSQRSLDTVTGPGPVSITNLVPEEDIKMKEKTFSFHSDGEQKYYAVILESVLSGHEGWIYSIHWQRPQCLDEKWLQPMGLLSASMDKTMIIWQPEAEGGMWVEKVRVGEVGGNTLGFYGGLFSPSGESILAHGYHGALHQWILNKTLNSWEPAVTGGGHFASVQDLDWEKVAGRFVLTTSLDQTTRLHAPWVHNGKYRGWYEIARPQIHGYDMQCLTSIKQFMFASSGDEKVIRIFQAPRNFIQNLCNICGLDEINELSQEETSSLPEGASVPALGLSNKAIFDVGYTAAEDNRLIPAQQNEQYPDVYFSPVALKTPPSEEHLLQNTLWPEIHKLYGHGYEVFAMASNPAGTLLASSCKAAKAEHAKILLWDTSMWRTVGCLEGSTLTVTQMAFSPSGQFLLAVSRDRTWSLYKCADSAFSRISFVDKRTTLHSRIIWSCAWSFDEHYFFTASRDKKVLVWCLKDVCERQPPKPADSIEMNDSVTAIDVAKVMLCGDRYLIATGLDQGTISLHTWTDSSSWTFILALETR